MNIDDIAKLLLAVSCSFGLVVVCFSLARLLLKLGGAVDDTRLIVNNVAEVADLATQDYKNIRATAINLANGVTFMTTAADLLGKVTKRGKASK